LISIYIFYWRSPGLIQPEFGLSRRQKEFIDTERGLLGLVSISLSVFVTIAKSLLVPQGFKNLTETIHIHGAEKFF
jgi:hypothetical protein